MPQRFLRPGIRTSQRWNRASFLAQSLYIGILTLVDDFGRYDGRAKLLHGEIFILRDDVKPQQTAAALIELVRCELIQLYQNDGKEYLQVLHWQERARCEQSKFPEPPRRSAADGSDPLLPSPSPSPSPSPVHHRHSSNGSARTVEPSDEVWLVELAKSEAYSGIQVKREFAKMVEWCKTRNKQATRRRFLNWLNRCERPVKVPGPSRTNPGDVKLPDEFRVWAGETYPKRIEEVGKMQTWADVPTWMREEWKRKKVMPLLDIN